MPTGAFFSDTLTPDSRAGGSYSSGAPSQPKGFGGGGMTSANRDYITAYDPKRQYDYQQSAAMRSNGQYGSGSIPFPVGGPPQGSQLAGQMGYGQQQGGWNSMVDAMYGPQQQLLAAQQQDLLSQLGKLGLDSDYQAGLLKRDNGLAMQLLGLDRQQLGLDKGLAQGQLGNLGKLRGILDKRRGIAGETKGLSDAEAKDMAGRKTFDLRSDLTARGSFGTIANERGTGRIDRDLGYQLKGNDITYRNTLLGLDEQGISYDNQELGLRHRLNSIGLDSERLGISEQQLQNSLADGLHQIGLGGMVSISQLTDAMTSGSTDQASIATEIMNAILGYMGLPMVAGYGGGGGSGARHNTTGTSNGRRIGGNYGT